MNITFTSRDLTGAAARRLDASLPETGPATPGVVAVERAKAEGKLETSQDWARFYATLPRKSGWDLLANVMNDPVFAATEAATRTALSFAPTHWQDRVTGVFWLVDLTRAGLAVRAHIDAAAADRDTVGVIASAAGVALDGVSLGAKLAGRPSATVDGLGLLVRYADADRKGHNLGMLIVDDHWRQEVPLYRLADGMAKVTEAALSDDPDLAGVTIQPMRTAIEGGAR